MWERFLWVLVHGGRNTVFTGLDLLICVHLPQILESVCQFEQLGVVFIVCLAG